MQVWDGTASGEAPSPAIWSGSASAEPSPAPWSGAGDSTDDQAVGITTPETPVRVPLSFARVNDQPVAEDDAEAGQIPVGAFLPSSVRQPDPVVEPKIGAWPTDYRPGWVQTVARTLGSAYDWLPETLPGKALGVVQDVANHPLVQAIQTVMGLYGGGGDATIPITPELLASLREAQATWATNPKVLGEPVASYTGEPVPSVEQVLASARERASHQHTIGMQALEKKAGRAANMGYDSVFGGLKATQTNVEAAIHDVLDKLAYVKRMPGGHWRLFNDAGRGLNLTPDGHLVSFLEGPHEWVRAFLGPGGRSMPKIITELYGKQK